MCGALDEVALDDPAIGHVVDDVLVSNEKTFGNIFVDVAVYVTVTVRTSPALVTVMVGGVTVVPLMLAASVLNMLVAVVNATAFDWVIIFGITAASAAASAAALRRARFCAAE